jgi:hypothetical protein
VPPASARRGWRIRDARLIGERLANAAVYYFQIRFSTSGQRMKPKYAVLFATTVCVHALAGTPPALTPQAVKEDIWRIGAKATVQRLYATHRWETVLEGIESGCRVSPHQAKNFSFVRSCSSS